MGPKTIKIFKSKEIQLVARLILGSIFIYASIDKIAFPNEFALIVKKFGILPIPISVLFAYILPFLELILGIFLIVGLFVRQSAAVLSFLLVVFMSIIIFKSINGTLENCGCFSTSQQESSHNLFSFLIRDTFLLLLCSLLYFSNKIRKNKDILSGKYA